MSAPWKAQTIPLNYKLLFLSQRFRVAWFHSRTLYICRECLDIYVLDMKTYRRGRKMYPRRTNARDMYVFTWFCTEVSVIRCRRTKCQTRSSTVCTLVQVPPVTSRNKPYGLKTALIFSWMERKLILLSVSANLSCRCTFFPHFDI